jgi:hypothetical protein
MILDKKTIYMNNKKQIVHFLLCVFTIINSYAQEQNGKMFSSIIGKGVADNYNQALEIAKRDALERSVGVYISSETIIKNDDLFKEKIYSLSSGFVKKYSIVSDVKLSEKMTEVVISADISKDAVIDEVKKLGVSVELNGGGLFDEMMQIKNYEDNEYSLFVSLFSIPSNYSPFTYTLTYDKPVFDEVKKEWTFKLYIQGRVDSSGKAILYKTKNILENASYDNNKMNKTLSIQNENDRNSYRNFLFDSLMNANKVLFEKTYAHSSMSNKKIEEAYQKSIESFRAQAEQQVTFIMAREQKQKRNNDKSEGGYTRLDWNGPEYEQLLKDYQSKTCVNKYPFQQLLAFQYNALNRKPYSPYLIELDDITYSVKDVRTFLFLRMFYFFEFLPNLKVKFLGNNGNVLKEELINKKIKGVTSRTKDQYPERLFEREFCEKTLNSFTKNYSFNMVNSDDYKRDSYYDNILLDHELLYTGNISSSPILPFLDLNWYSDLTIKHSFSVTVNETEFKSIAKIEVEGMPVLLKKDQ